MTKPRIRVDQKGAVTAVNGIGIADGMANVITGLGHSNMKSAATRYVVEFDSLERDNAYRASTWYGKIVKIPAADAVREWRAWQAPKAQIEKIEAEEQRLGVRNVVYEALLTARHTGGAVILIGGLPGTSGQPLRLDSIRAGSIKYLSVLGRDDITPGQIIRDPGSEWFGKPENWTLNTTNGETKDFHPSRVVFVNGRTVPGALRKTGEVWGDSIWVQMADSIRAADNVAGVIDALLHEAKIDVVQIKDLVSQMASGTAEQDYIRRWTMVAMLKSISNVLMLDGDDEWSQKQVTWTGLPDIARTLLTIMAGAADIPVTRLLMEQQTGLSGADSGSLKHYYDSIRSIQELEYTKALAPLDEIVIRSALGSRPDAIWYRWNPLYTMDDKQRAEVDKLEAEAVKIYAESGLIPQDAMATMVQNRLVESESWPGADSAYDASKMELELPENGEEDDPSAITADARSAKGIAEGDLVEFDSDQQAEKGPSSGHVVSVAGGKVVIAHSDNPGEEFEIASLRLKKKTVSREGKTLWVFDAGPRTLYVRRDVLNAKDIIAHFKAQGFSTTLPADDMHVTIAFSRQPVDWMKVGQSWSDKVEVSAGGPRMMAAFGDTGEAKVLLFASSELSWRHEEIKRAGASWDHPEYQPHITISYDEDAPAIRDIEPWNGKIVLGPEIFEEVNENWKAGITEDQQ